MFFYLFDGLLNTDFIVGYGEIDIQWAYINIELVFTCIDTDVISFCLFCVFIIT